MCEGTVKACGGKAVVNAPLYPQIFPLLEAGVMAAVMFTKGALSLLSLWLLFEGGRLVGVG